MDVKSPSKEVSPEITRELLISISNSLPDKILNQDAADVPSKGQDGVPVTNGDGTDKYRSELISISYSQSPDIAATPVGVGKPRP